MQWITTRKQCLLAIAGQTQVEIYNSSNSIHKTHASLSQTKPQHRDGVGNELRTTGNS